ncbi:ABC transporter permease [Streptomyces sp. NBC_00102]|uniref:ABC transporter permease n=1 Tax=Streptomyces sp. NBC_00102 TaxID=2975652 RepID=UPI00225037BB|nr:ABC transporter permease [Streptomyces sp. NBC_00102]MCX5398719.1 ABC transporter permease [Streptomyces sp. NBC_00102]
MLTRVLAGLRARWITFAGSFVALALGVGLVAATGLALAATLDAPESAPERFAAAPVVVEGADTLRVATPIGVRTRPLARPRPVPAALVARLSALGPTVEDRTFPVDFPAAGGPYEGAEVVGHPWSIAAATPYRLTSGRAPSAPGETVAATGPDSSVRPGDRMRLLFPGATGPGGGGRSVTVVGTVAATGFETALFFTDAEAARISPPVDALVVHADPAAVTAEVRAAEAHAAGGKAQETRVSVLTGAERRRADPDPDRDKEALASVNALLGTAAGITAFVSAAVVASTFSFAVAQRRREFGLLRTAGATPGQIRRTVYAEAVLVGVLASSAGCWWGRAGAPRLVAWMADRGIAPAWFVIGDRTWPLHVAFWSGLAVAVAGAAVSAHRAGRTGPTQALREAAVDGGAMPLLRRVLATLVVGGGIGLLVMALVSDPGELLKRKTYLTQPMVLIAGCALLAPVLVPPAVRLLTLLPARLPGASGLLARANASAAVRRTSAIAAPVLITVALATVLLGTTGTLAAAEESEALTRTSADFVVTAETGHRPLPQEFVDRAGGVPGAVVSASRSTGVTVIEEGVALVSWEAAAVDPEAFAKVSALPVAAGSLADLDDDSIVVTEEWLTKKVGERVSVRLGDGRKASLRIAAVLRTGTGDRGVLLGARNAAGAPVDRLDITVAPGADRTAVTAALRAAGRATGTEVTTARQWATAHHPRTREATRIGLLMVLGIALLCTGIALVNTLVMATSDRTRDFALLRLAGATTGQVLRIVAVEALVVVGVGALLGLAVSAVDLGAVRGALALLGVHTGVAVPWAAIGAVLAGAAVIAVVAAVLPAARALRARPVEAVGARE